jgi:2,3-diketo-5-methylthio-1-phosphopentane phosphatase
MPVPVRANDVAIICDFDGTIILEDTGELALKRFAVGDYEYYDQLLIDGKISLKECIETQYGMIISSEEEMLQHLMPHTQMRDGFPEFAAKVASQGIEMIVVSAGIEFVIRRVLGRDPRTAWLPLIAPKMQFEEGVLHADAGIIDGQGHGEFKAAKVAEQKALGREVIYIGDGLSDVNGSKEADLIFAVEGKRLARTCAPSSRCTTFMDFYEVIQSIL